MTLKNTGPAPALQQNSNSEPWEGQITLESSNSLRRGPQQTELPSHQLG